MVMSRFRFGARTVAMLLITASASWGAAKADGESEKPEGKFEPFKPETAMSTGTVTIGGQAIAYQAMAGTLIVHPKDWDDVPHDPKGEKPGAAAGEEGSDG